MACSEKYQVCNPAKKRCTGFNTTTAFFEVDHWRHALDLNEQQYATFIRLASLAYESSINSVTNGQVDQLLAQMYLISATGSLPVPKDQWHSEVRAWFQTVLARCVVKGLVLKMTFVDN